MPRFPEIRENVVFPESRRFRIGKRRSGGAVIFTLGFVVSGEFFPQHLGELPCASSQSFLRIIYTINVEEIENEVSDGV